MNENKESNEVIQSDNLINKLGCKALLFHYDDIVLRDLRASGKVLFEHDSMNGQLRELIKSRHPKRKLSDEEYVELIAAHLNGTSMEQYGVWVFYPWSGRLIHLLNEPEFTEVRTNRNKYKITPDEQKTLSSKRVGVIGLSVGQSVALTMAMERSFGELRLVDFDTLELSNLNRIRTGLHNLDVHKVVATAREIAEVDPYLKVTIFPERLSNDNINDFFMKDGQLDLLVEECDGLDMKIISRQKARELRIPVVMDTSDRGMIDVERFDLEPDRPILHGLAGDLDTEKVGKLKTNEEKVPYILQMIGINDISPRLKASMMEVEQTVNTWPQLASSVVLGGGAAADVARRVLLGESVSSGRYYVDADAIIPSGKSIEQYITFKPVAFDWDEMEKLVANEAEPAFKPDTESLRKMVDDACWATSTGNNQPWKWLYKNGRLHLFLDRKRAVSFGDYGEMGSMISLGAAVENLYLSAASMHIGCELSWMNTDGDQPYLAKISFNQNPDDVAIKLAAELQPHMLNRMTNRNIEPRELVSGGLLDQLVRKAETISGAGLKFINEQNEITEMGNIVAEADKLRLMHRQAHHEFYEEIRWTDQEATNTGDGVDIETLDITNAEKAGFTVAKDWNAVQHLIDWQLGSGFEQLSKKMIAGSSALGLITMPKFNREDLLNGGRAVQRVWILANKLGLAFQPQMSPPFFFARMLRGGGEGFPYFMKERLRKLRIPYTNIWGINDNIAEVFMFRIFKSNKPAKRSYRLPLDDILIIKG